MRESKEKKSKTSRSIADEEKFERSSVDFFHIYGSTLHGLPKCLTVGMAVAVAVAVGSIAMAVTVTVAILSIIAMAMTCVGLRSVCHVIIFS